MCVFCFVLAVSVFEILAACIHTAAFCLLTPLGRSLLVRSAPRPTSAKPGADGLLGVFPASAMRQAESTPVEFFLCAAVLERSG